MKLDVADHLAILQLYARYNFAADEGDGDAFVECFTPDGFFEATLGRNEGHEQLRAQGAGFKPMLAEREGTMVRHWSGNILLESLGPDRVRGRQYYLLIRLRRGGRPPAILTSATYEDEIVRHEGEWRFAGRTVTPDAGESLETALATDGV